MPRAARLSRQNVEMACEIAIGGMTCGGCVSALRKVLDRDGLAEVTVELGLARVPEGVDPARVRAAIEKAGFTVAER